MVADIYFPRTEVVVHPAGGVVSDEVKTCCFYSMNYEYLQVQSIPKQFGSPMSSILVVASMLCQHVFCLYILLTYGNHIVLLVCCFPCP